jgi:hypothetical protein
VSPATTDATASRVIARDPRIGTLHPARSAIHLADVHRAASGWFVVVGLTAN